LPAQKEELQTKMSGLRPAASTAGPEVAPVLAGTGALARGDTQKQVQPGLTPAKSRVGCKLLSPAPQFSNSFLHDPNLH
jgi:hypothetical protein